MKASIFIVAVVMFYFSPALLFADISPTEYAGTGIVPVRAPGIRMVSAKVDINWGMPCTLSATFVMENATSNAVDVQLGFPLNLPDKFNKKDVLGFSMAFNNIEAKPSDITEVGKPRINAPSNTTWYRCRHTFPPGQTEVSVKTKLPASLVYRMPYHENLKYCIETGASWEGTIGSEDVSIHFPGPITSDQIISATPAGYTVDGNVVHWNFKDFKPFGNDHDINMEYLRPDVVALLAQIRKEHANDPANPKWIIQLAKHLFVLGRSGGADNTPPSDITKADFEALLDSIKNNDDRAFIASLYAPTDTGWAKGGFAEKEGAKNAKDEFRAISVLSKTDYQVYFRKSRYLDEARTLMGNLVKAQPKNAEAWNVYLANFYQFGFAGVEPSDWVGNDSYFSVQTNLIKEAHDNCPDNHCIQLWYKRSVDGQPSSFETWEARSLQTSTPQRKDNLEEQLKKQGIFDVNYRDIDYGYY